MIIILHYCDWDAPLAVINLELCIGMDGKVPFNCVLAHERDVNKTDEEAEIKRLAKEYFKEVREFTFDPPFIKKWPEAPNWCWQHVAMHMCDVNPPTPWFWWEQDAIPLRKDWLQALWDEYKRGKKPFMGHIVGNMGHMNGVGVYPPTVPRYTQMAMLTRAAAWDVAMRDETIHETHNANHLIQHAWRVNADGVIGNWEQGDVPSFPNWATVEKYVDFKKVLFHRCKDTSLQQRLMEHYGIGASPTEKNVPQHTQVYEKPAEPVVVDERPLKAPSERPLVEISMPDTVVGRIGVPPVVEIFIVTYLKDVEWLRLSLRTIKHFCSGFRGVTVCIPRDDLRHFSWVETEYSEAKLFPYDEVKGKGMIQHEAVIIHADQYVDPDVQFVMYMDADCMFRLPTSPWDYFSSNLPHYVIRSYESLSYPSPLQKSVIPQIKPSDCAQWGPVVAAALGSDPVWYTMCRHPTVFPVDLLPKLQNHIRSIHGKSAWDYIMEQKNEFPQTFAEFPTMGAWAIQHARDRFFWIDCSNGFAPLDRMKNYWSHAGVNQKMRNDLTAKEEIESYLK